MSRTSPAIGFVGLGRMGGSMAARLLAAGYPVHGTARSRDRVESLLANGLRWQDTPRAVAEAADVVITSIPDDGVLNEIASGADGILAGLAPRMVWADMSTVSPRASRDLADRVRARDAAMLDSPVSGSVPQAQAGTLTIMVGGDEDAYASVEPILQELGNPTRIGPNGQGLVLKLAVNISLGVQMLAFAEGLVLAERSGVDPEIALGVMTQSAIASPMLQARAAIVHDLPDEAWFDLGFMQKDIRLALGTGREVGAPLPTADRASDVLALANGVGYEHRDIAALVQFLEELAAKKSEAALRPSPSATPR